MANAKVKITDTGYTALMRKILPLDGYHMTVGIHADSGIHHVKNKLGARPKRIVDIAWANEYGDASHYARPFTATAFERTYSQNPDLWVEAFLDGNVKPEEYVRKIGEEFTGSIKSVINSNNFRPNEERYVRKVKPRIGNRPLLFTGEMRDSVKAKVRKTKFKSIKGFTKNPMLMLRTGKFTYIPKAAGMSA